MKPKTAPSSTSEDLADEPDFPAPPDRRHEPKPEPAAKWQNLTLDELQAWMDEDHRRQGITP